MQLSILAPSLGAKDTERLCPLLPVSPVFMDPVLFNVCNHEYLRTSVVLSARINCLHQLFPFLFLCVRESW